VLVVRGTLGIAVVVAFCIASEVGADQFRTKCTYMDFATKDYFDGRCIVTSLLDSSGKYIEEFQAGKTRIRIVLSGRQGQWGQITFNGKPGMRFEENRYTFHYSPLDLGEVLDSTHNH
jgi:hypothetical protein